MFKNYRVDLLTSTQVTIKSHNNSPIKQKIPAPQRKPYILYDLQKSEPKINVKKHFIANRHYECKDHQFKQLKLIEEFVSFVDGHQAIDDADMISKPMIRNTKELKSRPSITRQHKRLLISTFSQNVLEYFSSTPMTPIYDQLKEKNQLQKLDQVEQGKYFGNDAGARHASKVMIRSIDQIVSQLPLIDHFNIKLSENDMKRILKRQPKVLQQSLNVNELLSWQKEKHIDHKLAVSRKIQLVDNTFAGKKDNFKDREVLYQVMLYQLSQALKQVERMERVTHGMKGLVKFHERKDSQLDQLKEVQMYVLCNYEKLVKHI